MRITEEAVHQAIRYTNEAEQNLINNLNHMKSITSSALGDWNDGNVSKFMEVLDLFDSYVKNTSANMEGIAETLRAYLNFMDSYNNY